MNRDGYDDLIASDSATGKLWLYPGTAAGGSFGARVEIGSSGWNHMSSLTAGDFNRDAYPDLAAVDDTTGKLWLYPGTATGGAFGQRVEIGSQGWERMHDLTTGRFNRDGYDDLIAVDSATGNLWLYPGTAAGGSFGARVVIGAGGWNGMSDLVGAEFTRDSYHDLIAVDSSTGKLWLYPGTTAGGSFGARKEIGSNGW
ncbi:VCBS repeat-containing protein [Kribbella sp. NPDC048915]|uniref:FG-GAP repeat domain-containing protein n=1 Tax=Kribbella sp. NPDC048915 TaxID=3155148 RepID=UPI0033F78806